MTQLKAIKRKGEIIFSSHEFLSHHRVAGFHSYLRQVRKSERKLRPNRRRAGERGQKSVNPSSSQFRRGLFQMLFLRLFVWADLRDLWAQKEEMFCLLRSTAETREVIAEKEPNAESWRTLITHQDKGGEGVGLSQCAFFSCRRWW